jgi:hypothetical protein
MSQNPQASSSLKFQHVFDHAIAAYKKNTGKDLTSDPLLAKLESCDSPDAVLAVLREQIPRADYPRNGGNRLLNWLDPTVHVLYGFSSTIGDAVSPVSLSKFEVTRTGLAQISTF